MDGPPEPKVPYREGKPLTEIIPPDRRRLKTLTLVVSSMIAGVALWVVGGFVIERLRAPGPRTVESTPGYIAGRVGPVTLHGPDQDVSLPPKTFAVVNVWLQGCADCMPAFEAMRRLEDEGGLGVAVPVYNIAYGEADPTWALRYGVHTNLVFDPGGTSVVRPLGIGTFTTLVIDSHGTILLRDRPDRPGYRARVRAAVHDEDPREPTVLDTASVARVVAAHRTAVKSACFDTFDTGGVHGVMVHVTVRATIGTDGLVENASSTGTDPTVAKCLEDQVRAWRFPPPDRGGNAVSVSIPFDLVRQ